MKTSIPLPQACARLRVDADKARRAAIRGDFPARFEGGRWVVDEADLPKLRLALLGRGGAA